MKKTVLVIAMVLATLVTIHANENDFEPQYDSDTHYIQNFADWGEYEVWCYGNGIEPIYSDFEKAFVADGHCDFDAMEKNGVDLEKETLALFENN